MPDGEDRPTRTSRAERTQGGYSPTEERGYSPSESSPKLPPPTNPGPTDSDAGGSGAADPPPSGDD